MAISRLARTIKNFAESDLTNSITTFCSAIPEGTMGLVGSSFFIGTMVDLVASRYTTITPLVFNISSWGYLASVPYATLAGYGSYKCHYEIGKSARPQLLASTEETLLAAEEDVLDNILTNFEPTTQERLERDDLIATINKLRAEKDSLDRQLKTEKEKTRSLAEENKKLTEENKKLKAEITQQIHLEDKEKQDAQAVSLTWQQSLGIAGEYMAHGTGFAGFVSQIIAGEMGFNLEISLTALCVLIGFLGAIPETQNARSCMQLNNFRERVANQHTLFKAKQKATMADNGDEYKELPSEVSFQRI